MFDINTRKQLQDNAIEAVQGLIKSESEEVTVKSASHNNDTFEFVIKVSNKKPLAPESIKELAELGLAPEDIISPFQATDGQCYQVVGSNSNKMMPLKVRLGDAVFTMGLNRFKNLHPKLAKSL